MMTALCARPTRPFLMHYDRRKCGARAGGSIKVRRLNQKQIKLSNRRGADMWHRVQTCGLGHPPPPNGITTQPPLAKLCKSTELMRSLHLL